MEQDQEDKKYIRLSTLPQGAQAIIASQDEHDFNLLLMEMGVVPGEQIKVEMVAPLGDPIAVKISGYMLSIRKMDAQKIWVLPMGSEGKPSSHC